MLYWSMIFLVVAVIASVIGLGGFAGASAGMAQVLFFIFLALVGLSLLGGVMRRAR